MDHNHVTRTGRVVSSERAGGRPGTSHTEHVDRSTGSGSRLLYTAGQAAQLLGIKPSWLRRKAAARAIPCTFVGEHLRFSPADLEAIVAEGARPAAGPAPAGALGAT
jgi:excisionase family DNA binding protein